MQVVLLTRSVRSQFGYLQEWNCESNRENILECATEIREPRGSLRRTSSWNDCAREVDAMKTRRSRSSRALAAIAYASLPVATAAASCATAGERDVFSRGAA